MTHLTCVASRRADIKDYLGRLAELGIDNILALRGDAPGARDPSAPPYAWESGDFQHASDLVAFIREEFPGFCIGVAGYPSPHPESLSLEQDRLYTAAKIRAGGDFLVTQLFFDPREYLDLVRDLRVLGVDKPVLPGVMPVQSLESLRRVLALCGAVIPPDYQRELEKANRLGGSEAVRKLGVEYAAGQVRALVAEGAPGVHLYTLNNADSCLKIATLAGF